MNPEIMTIKAIAEALCLPSFEACAKTIVPPWAEGVDCDQPARKAFVQVQTLRSQCAQLLAIWPEKKAKLDEQFAASVMILAAEVHEALYDLSA